MLNEIIKTFPKLENLRLRSSVLTKALLNGKQIIEMVFAYPSKLNSYDRAKIEDKVNEILPPKYISQITFEIDLLDGENFANKVVEFCESAYPVVAYRIKGHITPTIIEKTCNLLFDVDVITANAIEKFELIDKLTDYFAEYTCYQVSFEIKKHEIEDSLDDMLKLADKYQELQINREMSKPKRYLTVTDVAEFIGKKVTTKPRYIADLQSTGTQITICGKVHDVRIINYFAKNPDNTIKNPENPEEKKLLVFQLEDYTATIPVQFFPKKESLSKIEKLANGDEVVIQGNIRYDKTNNMVVSAVNICRCRILAEADQPKNTKEIPAQYVVVKPRHITVQKQASLDETIATMPEYLMKNNVVCLNVETTGDNVILDRIVRLNAVKITEGVIKSSFSTFVNPEVELDAKFLKDLGISAKALAEKPVIVDVIPDLFKYCAENTLVVYNADVSFAFVKFYAFACRYDFKYETHDILQLAIKSLSLKEQTALRSNSHNIYFLAEKLGLQEPFDKDKSIVIAQILLKLFTANDKLL